MATLNEIAYNIKELMSGGNENIENNISTRQIKHWIHYHRAKIIEEKILNKYPIDRRWIQPICKDFITHVDSSTYPAGQTSDSGVGETYSGLATAGPDYGITNTLDKKWSKFTPMYSYHGVDWISGGEEQISKNYSNYMYCHIKMSPTINVGQHHGITTVKLAKRVVKGNEYGSGMGLWLPWYEIPIKTYDEAKFDWASKFPNKTKQPFAVLSKNNTHIEIHRLKYSPKITSTGYENEYQYIIEIDGILETPTFSYTAETSDAATNLFDEIVEYNDATDQYPISNEDLPLLISRVAEIEMSLVLKTPEDLVEDNVDTSKIKIGGGQQRQQ
tara:strand:- start:10350 stop:11339 length:990 start_codon:yes stop_codon:yes gene_type:complete